jgi:hypothetical protein
LELIPRPNREEFHLPYQIEILPGIPPDNRALLQYFTCNASKALASHSFVHQEVCEVILPMAMGNLPLLYATLALAEIHRSALNSSIETGIDHDARRLVHHLTATSMRHLRKELEEPHLSPLGAKLATARTLFLCEAIAGSPTVRAWRAHFSGARALFSSRRQSPNGRAGSGEDSSLPFLQRWYTITEALVALTSEGLSGDQVASYGPRALLGAADSGDVCIDVYTGCAEDLAAAFREIGSVAWERRRTLDDPTSHPKLSVPYFVREAELLEISVRRMIERDKCRTTVFSMPGAHGLSGHEAREVLLCNEAYQHTALIHIHRRIRLLRSDAPQVQESVQRIIECVDSIKPAAALSPLTLLTTPLFTAGCEAKSAERRRIAHLLTNMFTHMRLPNMKRALHVLQAFWQESEVSGVDWEDFSRMSTSACCKNLKLTGTQASTIGISFLTSRSLLL